MRLIDADTFKEYICNAYEQVKHMYPDGGEWARQITEDFCKDIDEQPTAEAEPQWIPCSERLPNEYERMETYSHPDRASSFIVTIKGAIIPTVLYLTDDNYWKDENGHYYSVSAWMELPEVYREGNDEIN